MSPRLRRLRRPPNAPGNFAPCGTCAQCRAGQHQGCPNQFQPGFSAPEASAEFVGVDYADENRIRLPESIDAVTGASLGCRFATAFRESTHSSTITLIDARSSIAA